MSIGYKELSENLIFVSKYEKLREYNEINFGEVMEMAATAITDLLARAEAAEARAEKAERERDAAVKDLHIANDCDTCKTTTCVPRGGNGGCRFEWRGQKEE